MAAFFAAAFSIMTGMLALTVLFLGSAEDRRSPLINSFIFFATCILVWNCGYALMSYARQASTVLAIYRAASVSWAIAPSFTLYYAYRLHTEYSDRSFSSLVAAALFLPAPLFWFGTLSGRMLAVGFTWSNNGWIETFRPDQPLNYLYIATIMIALLYFTHTGISILRRSPSNRARLHARLVTWPIAAIIGLVLTLNLGLPLSGRAAIPPTAQLFIAVWVVFTASQLYKYPVFSLTPRIAADTIVNAISDMCFMVDNRFRIISVNPAVQEVLDLDPQKLTGQHADAILPKKLFSVFLSPNSEVNRKLKLEDYLYTAQNLPVPCQLLISQIQDSIGDQVGYVIIAREIREMKQLRELSETDMLTGAYNRRRMHSELLMAIGRLKRYQTAFSIIMVDLDHFKSVNDNFGHETGDRVLVQFCDIIRSCIRAEDLFVRWGGEEFMIICPETLEDQTLQLAERIRRQLEKTDFGLQASITASFGISTASGNDSAETVLGRADQALYHAKAHGRNRCTVYSETFA